MDLRHQLPWLCWELLLTMLYMLCMDKWSSLNIDLLISSNYVVIMIMLMSIYVYMYVCMALSDRDIMDHDSFMLYICCCLIGLLAIMIVLC